MRKPTYVRRRLRFRGADFEARYAEIGYRGRAFRFVESGRLAAKRIESFLTKEPSTLVWIDSFAADDVFYDVGANVGTYSVYAAVAAGCRVLAFEPESLNYAELNKNVFINGVGDRVTAFCCGVSDRHALTTLFLSRFAPAGSHHDCGENRWEGPVTRLAESPAHRPRQGVATFRLDDLASAYGLAPPTHIKVDVDGLERLVVDGAVGLLGPGSPLKTILVETDFKLAPSVELIDLMAARGWRYSPDQVCQTRGEGKISLVEWHHRLRERRGGCNIIYYRDPAYDRVFAEGDY